MKPFTEEEINILKEKGLRLLPGKLKSRDNPEEEGMSVCSIFINNEEVTMTSGDTIEIALENAVKYIKENIL